jgi:hypothetical protein
VTVSTEEPPYVRPDRGRRAWWWGVIVFFVVSFVLMFVLPAYLTLDPKLARVPLRADVPLHYPLLIAHVLTGTVAMVSGTLQVWPWLRRKHARAHRISGRFYVAAVLLGAPAALALTVLKGQHNNEAATANVLGFGIAAVLWFATTAYGFQRARQRRYHDHRRLMIYSFALTLSIIWSRVAFIIALLIPGFDRKWVVDNTGWVWWVLSLVIAQWWLNRTARRPLVLPTTASTDSRTRA